MLWIILNVLIVTYGVGLCLIGNLYKHIYFGWGLGDGLWYILMYILLIMHLAILLYSYDLNEFEKYWIWAISFSTLWIFISLKATIWRGHEARWNGKIFHRND